MATGLPDRAGERGSPDAGGYPAGGGSIRGVAPVPPARPPLSDTDDRGPGIGRLPDREPVSATWPDHPARVGRRGPTPELIVRRRGRHLRSGAPWTWTGLSFVLICWGIWVVSVRGTELVGPAISLGLVLATAALMFVLARLLGRAVFEQALGRERSTAWPSHLTVCGFLTAAGVAFLQQTRWVSDSWRWWGEAWRWWGDLWQWVGDAWPW